MIASIENGTGKEVSKSDPCPICQKPDWCFLLPDGAINCKREESAPQGWVRASKDAKDGTAIFQPERNRAVPRPNRELPSWKRTGKTDGGEFEKEIIFRYSDTQRVLRRQWSDRRPVYRFKNGKPKNKMVVPQHLKGKQWAWGKGGDIWPLYRSDDLLPTDVLFYVGGETCVETLRKWGFSATCNQGGEGNNLDQTVELLRDLRFFMLVIIPDNDEQGMKSAEMLLQAVIAVSIPAAILSPLDLEPHAPPKWDIADWGVPIDEAQGRLRDAVSWLRPKQYEAPPISEKAQGLRDAITQYAALTDPFEKAIAAQDMPVKGRLLENLAREVAPVEESSIATLSADSESFLETLIMKQQGMIPPGIQTGYGEIDRIREGGLHRGHLDVYAGRPSMGKTTLVTCIAYQVALFNTLPVAIFSLEMTREELWQRLIAMKISIELGRLRSGRVSIEEIDRVATASYELDAMPLFIDDKKRITTRYIEDACKRIQDDTGQPLGMVMVDYLTNMADCRQNRYESVSQNVRDLKDMAGVLNVPVALVCQLNRAVEGRTNQRPIMSDLRETGEIEQQADSIGFVYRDEAVNPDTADRGIGELIYVKQRQGMTGTVKLLFEGQYARFRNMTS
jgi:replicative DNA helicase